MKKKILFVITLMVSIFSFSSSVLALTKINFKETGNGQINTTLHFEEGFVGGIDITLKVKGNVSVQDFKFADKIVSSKYDSEYVYDKDKNTLIIRVTTGGIGSSHNLLNNKKELELGTINFTSSDKADVVYELEETAFKIVGNNWESQVIDKESITLGDDTEFVYKAQSTTTPDEPSENPGGDSDVDDDKPGDNEDEDKKDPTPSDPSIDNPSDTPVEEDPNNPSESTPGESTGGESSSTPEENSSESTDKNTGNSSSTKPSGSNNSTGNSSTQKPTDDKDEQEEDKEQDKDETNIDKDKDSTKEEKPKSSNTLIWILIGATGVVIVTCITCLVIKNRKNR